MRLLRIVAALVSALFVVPLPVRGQSEPTIRVGITQSDCCVEALYAQDLALFKKAGLNVEVVPFTSVAALGPAVASGTADIGVATIVQIAEGVSHGIPFRIIAAGGIVSRKEPGSALMVAGGSKIDSAKDLVGQTVAVINLKTTAEFALKEWLVQNKVDPATVHTIEMPFGQMGPAVARGTVAAALLSEPSLGIAEARDHVRPIAVPTDTIAKQYMVSAWFTTESFVQAHPDVAKKFARVIYQTARWANSHQAQSGAILAEYAKIDPAVLAKMARVVYADRIDIADIQPVLDLSFKYHAIAQPVSAVAMIARP